MNRPSGRGPCPGATVASWDLLVLGSLSDLALDMRVAMALQLQAQSVGVGILLCVLASNAAGL